MPHTTFHPLLYKQLINLATATNYLPDVVGQILLIQGTNIKNSVATTKVVIGLLLSRSKRVRLTLMENASDRSETRSRNHYKHQSQSVQRPGILLTVIGPNCQSKLSVYDNNDHASFVLLGDAGRELTGMKASELVESYFEANESVGDDHVVPVPSSLTDFIGQTRTFVIKVSKHNLDGKTQSKTVTKVLPLKVPVLEGNIDEDVEEEPADEKDEAADGTTRTFVIKVSKHNLDGKTQSLTVTKVLPLKVPALKGNIDENVEEEPADEKDGAADGTVKRNSDGIESGETKRAKCG
ncbi:hypothetical protein F2Q68_00044455 [Brassica cretica]|uniref:Uncharacterized protein n=1 Tax=Brassica cretica TaxID=69181 RepID=A0A8S9LT25_BRACR|nr:hypothetical protein F2Q68_00044455 [Brassica cretica]